MSYFMKYFKYFITSTEPHNKHHNCSVLAEMTPYHESNCILMMRLASNVYQYYRQFMSKPIVSNESYWFISF